MPMNAKRLNTINIFLMLLLSAIFGIRNYNSLLIFIAFFGLLVLLFVENQKKESYILQSFFVIRSTLLYFEHIRFKLIFKSKTI
jgi:hypothetical protein